MTEDNAALAAAMLALATALVVVSLLIGLHGCVPDRPTTPATPTAGACPLDAISYESPVWMPECTRCQRVTDRITGRRWWLLKMSSGAYVVLPLDETEVGE